MVSVGQRGGAESAVSSHSGGLRPARPVGRRALGLGKCHQRITDSLRTIRESAKYAADFRNYHWQHLRKTGHPVEIVVPANAGPYPSKADQISDKPTHDGGNN